MSLSQFKSKMRQAVNKHNQQVRQINRKIDQVNRAQKQAIDAYNRDVRRYNQNAKQAVAKYNQAVRTHNNQVRSNRTKLQQQINALKARPTNKIYFSIQTSTYDLHERFERVAETPAQSDAYAELVALSERESSNSAVVAGVLLDDAPTDTGITLPEDTGILEYLSGFSQDICDRWRGAIFSLNPANPDAGRHFCTSAREIFTEILENWAADKDVIDADSNCERTQQGKPTRRSKVRYLLDRKGIATPELVGFVDADIDNIIQLFNVFNEATHGPAGKHAFTKLQAIRQRVESGIMFLAAVAV